MFFFILPIDKFFEMFPRHIGVATNSKSFSLTLIRVGLLRFHFEVEGEGGGGLELPHPPLILKHVKIMLETLELC